MQRALAKAAIPCPTEVHSAPTAAPPSPSLPTLVFPPGFMSPTVIAVHTEHCHMSALACDKLLAEARKFASQFPGGIVVFGFDCEWAASLTSRRKVAVLQFSCVNGFTVIFHIKSRASRASEAGIMPSALKEPIENEEVQLVSAICGGPGGL